LAAGGLAEQPDRRSGGGQVGEPVDVVGQVLVGGQQREAAAGQVQGQVAGDQRRGRVVGLPAGAVDPTARSSSSSAARNQLEFIDAVLTRGELEAVDRYLAPEFVNHDPLPGFAPDREGMRQTALVFRQAFPDWHAGQQGHIAEGDLVAERFTARGTHQGEIMGVPPTGREVSLAGINIFRVQGGQLVERWGRTDDLGFLQQLGIVPAMSS
jgi:predicted ester cyclase